MARPKKPDLSYEEFVEVHQARQKTPRHGSGWIALAARITDARAGDVATPSIRFRRGVSARWVKDQYESRINQIQEILALPLEDMDSGENSEVGCATVNRASTPGISENKPDVPVGPLSDPSVNLPDSGSVSP